MKKEFLALILFSTMAYGQSKPYQFIVENVTIASAESRIEIKPNGDTVLISNYNNANLKQNVQNQLVLEYKGTPYFQNGWYKGRVVMTDKSKESYGVIAFDLIRNTVFFTYSDSKEAIPIKPFEFEINGHRFRRFTNEYVAAGDIYYEKLVEGETELFRQFSCIYRPASGGEKTGYEQSGDGYEGHFDKKEFYFVNYHEKMQRVGKKFKIFEKNESKAKEFAEKNNLSLNNLSDLIKVVKYINSIENQI